MQIVTLLGEGAAARRAAHIDALLGARQSLVRSSANMPCWRSAGCTLVWERHTEFATYTLMRPGAFDTTVRSGAFRARARRDPSRDMPGEIVRATQIALLAATTPDRRAPTLARWFADEATVVCDVADGTARIMSDFRLQRRRLWPAAGARSRAGRRRAGAVGPAAAGTRQLPQHGAARPAAGAAADPGSDASSRRGWPADARGIRTQSEDDQLLDELTFLSAELARLVAETRYRMSATRAYAQISIDRLAGAHDRRGAWIPDARRLHRAAADAGGAHVRFLFRAARGSVAARRLDQRAAAHADRHRARQAKSRPAGLDGPPHAAAAPAAADGRGALGGGDQLLSGRR